MSNNKEESVYPLANNIFVELFFLTTKEKHNYSPFISSVVIESSIHMSHRWVNITLNNVRTEKFYKDGIDSSSNIILIMNRSENSIINERATLYLFPTEINTTNNPPVPSKDNTTDYFRYTSISITAIPINPYILCSSNVSAIIKYNDSLTPFELANKLINIVQNDISNTGLNLNIVRKMRKDNYNDELIRSMLIKPQTLYESILEIDSTFGIFNGKSCFFIDDWSYENISNDPIIYLFDIGKLIENSKPLYTVQQVTTPNSFPNEEGGYTLREKNYFFSFESILLKEIPNSNIIKSGNSVLYIKQSTHSIDNKKVPLYEKIESNSSFGMVTGGASGDVIVNNNTITRKKTTTIGDNTVRNGNLKSDIANSFYKNSELKFTLRNYQFNVLPCGMIGVPIKYVSGILNQNYTDDTYLVESNRLEYKRSSGWTFEVKIDVTAIRSNTTPLKNTPEIQ